MFISILDYINYFLIAILTIMFVPQILFVVLSFCKNKIYEESEKKFTFAVIIAARNEERVIGNLLDSLLKQNYPKDKLKIFVIADNCTDNTKKIALEKGVHCIERNNNKMQGKGYALQHAIKYILQSFNRGKIYKKYFYFSKNYLSSINQKKYINKKFSKNISFYKKNYFNKDKQINNSESIDCFVFFDADNVVHCDCITKYNNAFASGVKFGKGYANSKNFNDNIYSAVNGLYYLRDERFTCRVRSFLGLSQNVPGSGMMVSSDILQNYGFDAVGLSEDAEFTVKRLLNGYNAEYISEAIFYEEQPTNKKDLVNRNIRIGKGVSRLFFSQSFSLLLKFFKSFKFKYLDIFLSLLFVPIAVICTFWFPFYYIFELIYTYLEFPNNTELFYNFIKNISITIIFFFYIPFFIQAIIPPILERKKTKHFKKSKIIIGAILFPFYMIFYMITIAIGAVKKNVEWKAINHNRNIDIV